MQPSLARKAAYERFRWWTIAAAGFVGFGLLALYLALSPPADQFKLR